MRLVLAIVLAALLAGCASSGQRGFDEVTARLHNTGTSSMTVPFTITADGKTLLSESIVVAGGATVERTVAAVPGANYVLHATYHAVSTSGSSQQEASGSRSHTLTATDCSSGTVVVTFEFRYTVSDSGQQFNSGTSFGTCPDDG